MSHRTNDTPLAPRLMQAEREREDAAEQKLRPTILAEFIGQQSLIKNLSVFVQAARTRNESLDHLLFSGPPGLGKTTLAHIVARELAVNCHTTSAPAVEKPKDLVGILSSGGERDVLFIDEIHRLRNPIEELLYTAMEEYRIDWVVGQGAGARTVRIPLPHFTLVGATTRPGKLSAPLASRFGIHLRIDTYTTEELATIVQRSAELMGLQIVRSCSLVLAARSRGTPRIANRLLRRLRDFAQVAGTETIDSALLERGLQSLGIDSLGLEELDRRILIALVDTYNGGPVGVETLAISVGESAEALEEYYEPYLIQRGLLQRTARGRVATRQTYRYLQRPLPASAPALFVDNE